LRMMPIQPIQPSPCLHLFCVSWLRLSGHLSHESLCERTILHVHAKCILSLGLLLALLGDALGDALGDGLRGLLLLLCLCLPPRAHCHRRRVPPRVFFQLAGVSLDNNALDVFEPRGRAVGALVFHPLALPIFKRLEAPPLAPARVTFGFLRHCRLGVDNWLQPVQRVTSALLLVRSSADYRRCRRGHRLGHGRGAQWGDRRGSR